jgi:membrane-associated phospholipid phosphatase
VATVIAHRYGRHRWVPFVAYGAATLIGFSRVTTQAHFPSDVFLGAALGFAVAQFDVLHAPAFGLGH